jgi:phage N-6-adenine-methyltransferase
MTTSEHAGPSIQNYATPWPLVWVVERELGVRFALDACAEEWSTKAEHFYSLPQNGLAEKWRDATWCNPPYEEQDRWLARGAYWADLGVRSVHLVKASTSALYWRPLTFERGVVDLFEGRIAFIDPATGEPKPGSSFASAMVWMGPGFEPGVVRVRSAESFELVSRLQRGVVRDLFTTTEAR